MDFNYRDVGGSIPPVRIFFEHISDITNFDRQVRRLKQQDFIENFNVYIAQRLGVGTIDLTTDFHDCALPDPDPNLSWTTTRSQEWSIRIDCYY